MDSLDLLEGGQPIVFHLCVHFLDDGFLQEFAGDGLCLSDASLLSKSLQVNRVRYNYCNKAAFEGVTVDEDLGDLGDLRVNVLELLWGDVLSLRELEDVLCSVCDFDGAVGEDDADIARVDPAILREGLLGTTRVLEITLELVGALELNFTTRRVVG